jgi:hypothetical protein
VKENAVQMFLIIKKSYRLMRIILHVIWGAVQVIYYLDAKKIMENKENNMLGNLWSVLEFDHITADIYFTPFISSENMTRKILSAHFQKQMQEKLKEKI